MDKIKNNKPLLSESFTKDEFSVETWMLHHYGVESQNGRIKVGEETRFSEGKECARRKLGSVACSKHRQRRQGRGRKKPGSASDWKVVSEGRNVVEGNQVRLQVGRVDRYRQERSQRRNRV